MSVFQKRRKDRPCWMIISERLDWKLLDQILETFGNDMITDHIDTLEVDIVEDILGGSLREYIDEKKYVENKFVW